MIAFLIAQAASDPDLIRPYFSFDFDDIISLLLAVAAVATLYVTKKSKNVSLNKEEVYDADVLSRFERVWERVGHLENEVNELRLGIRILTAQLEQEGHRPLYTATRSTDPEDMRGSSGVEE